MMSIETFEKFMGNHKDQIIDIFITYQMLELTLFIKLHFPLPVDMDSRGEVIKKLSEKMDYNTLGKLQKKYLKKFPKDEYGIKSGLETVKVQRNIFMHSMWALVLARETEEKMTVNVEKYLNDFKEEVDILLGNIVKWPE